MQPFSFQIEDDMTRQAQFQLSFQKFYVKHDDDDDGEEEDADDEGARGKFRKKHNCIYIWISFPDIIGVILMFSHNHIDADRQGDLISIDPDKQAAVQLINISKILFNLLQTNY